MFLLANGTSADVIIDVQNFLHSAPVAKKSLVVFLEQPLNETEMQAIENSKKRWSFDLIFLQSSKGKKRI